ncbi:hypothetical protein [Pararhizobium gei]|uniref:hypothetical protein n=1 Tax=Pararhizobium gei TaxID=1395951 RepID=UPI0023D9E976|nr:hypothetical protein [Rhizobium gei]
MTNEKPVAAPKDVKTFANKHRIDIEDAQRILAQHGDDRKAADREARRVAV